MAFGGENAESYHDEGLTAAMRGDLEKAVTCFERAIELDRSFFGAYHQLGKCFLRMGEPRRALDLLKQVVAVKPNLVHARVDLAYAALELGKVARARELFAEVVAHQPENARARLGEAHCEFHEGRWTEATNKAKAALDLGGANFGVLYLLGRAANLSGDAQLAAESMVRAEKIIEQLVESNPNQPEGYFLRGELLFAQERFGEALDAYRSAEDRAENHRHYTSFGEHFTRLDMLAKRGLCLQHVGRGDAAREVGEQILRIDGEHRIGRLLAGG
mgnify:CR=1 FL=1